MLWTYKCPKPVFSSPALLPSSDCIVIGCVDGGVYIIASNGQHVSLLPVLSQFPLISVSCIHA